MASLDFQNNRLRNRYSRPDPPIFQYSFQSSETLTLLQQLFALNEMASLEFRNSDCAIAIRARTHRLLKFQSWSFQSLTLLQQLFALINMASLHFKYNRLRNHHSRWDPPTLHLNSLNFSDIFPRIQTHGMPCILLIVILLCLFHEVSTLHCVNCDSSVPFSRSQCPWPSGQRLEKVALQPKPKINEKNSACRVKKCYLIPLAVQSA